VPEEQVVSCSTGSIGRQLNVSGMEAHFEGLVQGLAEGSEAGEAAAEAIRTTDKFTKQSAVQVTLEGQTFCIGGMAKGAQMISPGMATTLSFITTDISCDDEAGLQMAQTMLRDCADRSFNEMSVDGNTSTNDTILLVCTGSGPVSLNRTSTAALQAAVEQGLQAVCSQLATKIVEDGSGTTKLVEFKVTGARSTEEARIAVRAVAGNQQVKVGLGNIYTMGVTPMLAALGASGVDLRQETVSLHVGVEQVVAEGMVVEPMMAYKKRIMPILQQPNFTVTIDLGMGTAQARMLTNDLNVNYLRKLAGGETEPQTMPARMRKYVEQQDSQNSKL